MSGIVGQVIAARYRVDSIVGAGGSGTVYKAIQEPLGRPVALKMLKPELSENPSVRRRFVREARAVAALSHPNIATIHDFGSAEGGGLYIALEFVDGVSLADLLHREMLGFEHIREIFDQILAGLGHAHSRGVIHRDIKPANILITSTPEQEYQVKIVDFGIAMGHGLDWSDDGETTGNGRVVGTPHFMAPEQARGERHLTTTVDLYNVGLMLYWAVTGRHAFDGPTPMDVMMAQVSAPVPPIVPLAGLQIPPGLDVLITDALKKSPRERVASSASFRTRLRSLDFLAAASAQQAAPSTPASPSQRSTSARQSLNQGHHTLREDQGVSSGFDSDDPITSTTPAVRSTASSVVGRASDRSRLLDAAERALVSGRGVFVTIEGEAGLGKTTLANWLREELQHEFDATHAFGAFHRDGERALRGFRDAFDMLLDTRGVEGGRLAAAITRRLGDWGLADPRDAARLVAFLRPAMRASDTEANSTGNRTEALWELLFRILEHTSQFRPILLVIDDLHWAGPEAASFVEFLASEFAHRKARVVIVATIQPEDMENVPLEETLGRVSRFHGDTVYRLQLDRLEDSDALALIRSMIDASQALSDALISRTGGNPMHLVQLIRYLSEERLLETTPNGLRPRRGVDVGEVLPPGLADIIGLRIEQVGRKSGSGERVHALLDRAAVLGRSFRFSVLERMLQMENRSDLLESVDEDVDALLDLELLRMTETREDDILSFPTSLIRDVVLERLRNRRTTRKLHVFAAEAKLEVLGKESDKAAAELVQHFAAARDRSRELQYSRIAADVAERSHRPHDAMTYLERSLSLIEEIGDESADFSGQRATLQIKAAALHVGFGHYAEAQQKYSAVLNGSAATPDEKLRARVGLAGISFVLGDFSHSSALYREAVEVAREYGTRGTLVDALLGTARVELHRGNFTDAQPMVDEALRVAQLAQDEKRIAECHWASGEVQRGIGEVTNASGYYLQALERFTRLDVPLGIAKSHAMLAVLARMSNNLDEAVTNYRQALDIYQVHGGRRGMAHQLNGLGDVARFRGDYRTATEHYRRAVDIFQALQLPFDAAIALTNLALVARESGNLEEAKDALRRALLVAERVGFAYLTLGVKLNLAHVLALGGEDEESNALLEESLALADRVDLIDPDYARPLEMIGDLKASTGRLGEADALYARAREMWEELGREDDIRRMDRRIHRVPEA
jgi:serine/threonine protein kinase/tetratricopeptide (TPR) repeat protein